MHYAIVENDSLLTAMNLLDGVGIPNQRTMRRVQIIS